MKASIKDNKQICISSTRVDIIMGIYNCEKYLADSIESILRQTFENWRLILCDDSSSDKTFVIAEKYAKKYPDKIILLKNDKNMGLNYTLNKCLEYTNAKYIARQDGDDLSKPDRLEKEVAFLDSNPNISFVSSNAELFDCDGVWGKVSYSERPTKYDFLKISPFCHAAVLIRRDAINSVNGYTVDDRLLRVEDYHLWFKLYANGLCGANLRKCLYMIRDDRDAANRRTWMNRKNEYYVRKIGFRMLNIPWHLRFYKYRPIVLGLLPSRLSEMLHKSKLKNKA